MRTMTDEERRLVEENQKLVYFTLRKIIWDAPAAEWEEYVQLGMMGLCYAAMAWRPEKGAFATLASRCIEMEVRKYVRYQRQACRDKRKEAFSLDAVMIDHDNITFGEVLMADDTMEEKLDVLFAREALTRLKGRDKQMMDLMLEGKTQTQIGDALGLSQSYVARCLQRITRQIREEVCA